MVVGQSAPRYESMSLLYRRSNRLGQCLNRYFIVVVKTCHHFIAFSKKPMISQFTASLDDSRIRDAQLSLEEKSRDIKEEIAFLTSETIEGEANENRTFRDIISGQYLWKQHEKKVRRQVNFLDSLSVIDHETPYRQARKSGTSTVFQSDAAYATWKESEAPTSLALIGKLGSGKSVTMANVVEDLYLSDEHNKVTYYFCRHDNANGLTARAAIGSFTRQLVIPFLDDSILDKVAGGLSHPSFTLGDVMSLIEMSVPKHTRAYFVIDGIDECPLHEANEIMKALGKIQAHLKLLVLVSVRSGAQDYSSLFSPLFKFTTFPIPIENPDITTFIDHELCRRIAEGQLVLGDETIILDIRDALLQGANGMSV